MNLDNNVLEKESIKKKRLYHKIYQKTIYHQILSLSKLNITYIKLIIIFCFLIFLNPINLVLFLKTQITIDNRIKYDFEDNISFSKYSTTIKPIALYEPEIDLMKSLNNHTSLLINDLIYKKLENQINLAKIHGIYGFGIYYSWPFDNSNFNETLEILLENKNLDINFFLIFKKEENEQNNNFSISGLFYDIKKYILDKRYIKFDNKSVIGINYNDIKEKEINTLKQMFKESQMEDIFILSNIKDDNITNIINQKTFDGFYYSTNYYTLEKIIFDYNNTFGYFYTDLIYYNLFLQLPKQNNKIFRTSIVISNYPKYIKKTKTYIYGDYSPEKFYFLNKIIMEWTLAKHNIKNQYNIY